MATLTAERRAMAAFTATLSEGEFDCFTLGHHWSRPKAGDIDLLGPRSTLTRQKCDSCSLRREKTRHPDGRITRRYDPSDMKTGNYFRTGQGHLTSEQRWAAELLRLAALQAAKSKKKAKTKAKVAA